eukprot:9660356-Prorocentrum_lima.AAC.1
MSPSPPHRFVMSCRGGITRGRFIRCACLRSLVEAACACVRLLRLRKAKRREARATGAYSLSLIHI